MSASEPVQAFWQAYLASLPSGSTPAASSYETWHFGDNEQLANELAALVCSGVKIATSSLLWEDQANGEALPTAGTLAIVTTWDGTPCCIIELTEITVQPFNAVDEAFAFDYGEGERSLAWWRRALWNYYGRVCATIGRTQSESMPLVCQRFRRVFPT